MLGEARKLECRKVNEAQNEKVTKLGGQGLLGSGKRKDCLAPTFSGQAVGSIAAIQKKRKKDFLHKKTDAPQEGP